MENNVPKTEVVSFRLTAQEKRQFELLAKALNTTKSSFMHRRLKNFLLTIKMNENEK